MYNNWNMEQDSLFYELNELNPNGIISELGVENLNFMFAVQYGSRDVPSMFIGKTTKEVAKHINQLYMSRWLREKQINEYVDNLEIGVTSTISTDENNTGSNNKTVTNNNVHKVSAFNVDELTPANSSDDDVTEIGDNESVKQNVQKRTDIKSVDYLREINDNNMSSIICKDVSRVITLAIY